MKPLMMEEAQVARGTNNIVIQTLIFLLVFIVISIPSQIAASIAAMPEILRVIKEYMANPTSQNDLVQAVTNTMLTQEMIIAGLFLTVFSTAGAIIYCKFIEKRPLGSMGIRRKGIAKHYLLGLLIGFAMISATFGLAVATGSISVEKVTFSINWLIFAAFLFGFLFQGAGEEIIFRGYLMNTLGAKCEKRYSVVLAVIISSVAFSFVHLQNPGITALALLNIALYGVFMGIYMITFDNIWGVCGIHSMWNFAQGSIFGISVSGLGADTAIITPSLAEGKALLNGGSFGLEGSVLCTVIVSAAILATLMYRRSRIK